MNKFLFFINIKPNTLCAILLVLSSIVHAQTDLAVWNFESFVGGFVNPTTSFGSGTAAVITQTGTAPNALGTQGGNGNATGCGTTQTGAGWQIFPFDAGTYNESNGIEFRTSTVGYENIKFYWDLRWSNSVPNTLRLQYTLDGSTWIGFNMIASNTIFCNGALNANGTYEAASPGDSFRRFEVNLTAITGAANNANFGVRLLAAHYQSTGEFRQTTDNTLVTTNMGAYRFDNVAFKGDLIAGPSVSTISASSATVCGGDSVNLSVAISGGSGPFNLVYTNDGGTTQFVIPNYTGGTNISITPTATRTYTIVSVQNAPAVIDISNFGSSNGGAPTVTFVAKPTFTAVNGAACAGAFDLRTLFTGQSPIGGSGIYFNVTTNLQMTAFGGTGFNGYTGGSFVLRYTYTRNGCATTATVNFTRNTAPAITTQPSAATQTVCQGDVCPALTVAATGTGLVYGWYVNNTNSTTGGTLIPSSNSASYTPPSTIVGTRYYYVQINGTCTPAVKSTNFGTYVVVDKTTTRTISSPQTICSGYAPANLTLSGSGSVTKWQKADDLAFTTNVIDIANSTATLATGNIASTTYFRALVSNGNCDVFTAPIAITIKTANYTTAGWDITPDATTTAIFWDNFSSTASITTCNVIIKPGKNVIINANHTFTVQNDIDAAAGSITFENNANLYQVNNNANANLGNIIFKCASSTMKVYDFTYWSSPVAAQTLYNFSPNTFFDKYYSWDTTPSVYFWKIHQNGAQTMDLGTGYAIRSPLAFGSSAAVFNGVFSGVPNNGIFTKSIEVSNGGLNNLNLVGNPYPSVLDADAFFDANDTVIFKTLYLWTHNTAVANLQYTSDDYAIYNYLGGVGTRAANNLGINNNVPTSKIAAGQGFFVRAKLNGNLVFSNTMRLPNNDAVFYRNANTTAPKDRLWLEIANNQGAFSQMLYGFIAGATNGLDDGYDAMMFNSTPTIRLYSVLDNNNLTIKSDAPPFNDNKTNQIGFISKINGEYDIKLAMVEGVFDYQNVYLQDNLLNIVHDLKLSDYHFSTSIGTFNDRFLLKFNANNLSNNNVEVVNNNVNIFKNTDSLIIQSGLQKIKNIAVYDTNGRLLLSKNNIDANEYKTDGLKIANQLLIVKITTSDDGIIAKKVIF